MCDACMSVRDSGEASGRIMERIRNITELLNHTDWTMETVLEKLGITEQERAEVQPFLCWRLSEYT